MKNFNYVIIVLVGILIPANTIAQDSIKAQTIGHGTVMLEYNNLVIHVDPVTREANYENMPDADLILVTHQHGDHLDINAINQVKKEETVLVYTQTCANQINYTDSAIIMANGDSINVHGLPILAVPAYNHTKTYHPKGVGNGYVVTFGNQRVYIAGDTENIPEMGQLGEIDIAFLPMNQPYTMTADQAANAALMIKPKVLNIYHYQSTYIDPLIELLKDETEMEIRADDKTIKPLGEYSGSDGGNGGNGGDSTTHVNKGKISGLRLFPNPAQQSIMLNHPIENGKITISNVSGKIVYEQKVKTYGIIDVSNLKSGLYFLGIQSENDEIIQKFVKN